MKKSTKVISLFLAIVMVLSIIPLSVFAASASLTLSASKEDIKAGDEVVVNIILNEDSGIGVLTFDLLYDWSAFEIVGVVNNDSNFVVNPKFAKGKARVAGATTTTFMEAVDICTITFKALEDVDSTISVEIIEACDENFNFVTVKANKISFNGIVEESTTYREETTTNPIETTTTVSVPIKYSVASASGNVGDIVEIKVNLYSDIDLWGANVSLSYNPDELQFVSCYKGDVVGEGFSINHTGDEINFSGMYTANTGSVFYVKFKIIKDCKYSLLTVNSSENTDYDGVVYPCDVKNGGVTVKKANPPSLTVSASKTYVKVGETVTVTVAISENSGLGVLTADLVYDAAAFKVTNMTAASDAVFGAVVNGDFAAGKARYTVAADSTIEKAGTLFTVKLLALKAGDSKVSVVVDEACDKNYAPVDVAANAVSFKVTAAVTECAHDYSEAKVVTAATCKKAGVSQKSCKICGDIIEEAIPATGKCIASDKWEITKYATATTAGEKVQKCKNCGEVVNKAVIPALGSSIPETDEGLIKNPSRTTIRNKDGIVIHINPQSDMPAGSYIEWTYDSKCFKVDEAGNGMKITAVATRKGWTVFTATVYTADGEIVVTDSVELYSKSGFSDRIAGFFRSLFGTTELYEY